MLKPSLSPSTFLISLTISYLYCADGLMQPHVHVPGENVLWQAPHYVQLFVGLFLQELGVHLLPAVSLPLRLLLVDDSNSLPHLLQVVQLMSTPVNRLISVHD